jgi:hypothetical protein
MKMGYEITLLSVCLCIPPIFFVFRIASKKSIRLLLSRTSCTRYGISLDNVACMGVCLTKERVLDRMIGFIGTSLTNSLNHTQL